MNVRREARYLQFKFQDHRLYLRKYESEKAEGFVRFSRISHRGCRRYQRGCRPAVLIARFTGFELQLTAATLHKHLRNA